MQRELETEVAEVALLWCARYRCSLSAEGCKGAIADAIVAEQLLLEGVPSGLLPKWQVQRMLVCGKCAGVVDVNRCREILEQEYQSALKELEEMDWDRGAAPADRAAESKRRYHLENREVRNKQRQELRARTGR